MLIGEMGSNLENITSLHRVYKIEQDGKTKIYFCNLEDTTSLGYQIVDCNGELNFWDFPVNPHGNSWGKRISPISDNKALISFEYETKLQNLKGANLSSNIDFGVYKASYSDKFGVYLEEYKSSFNNIKFLQSHKNYDIIKESIANFKKSRSVYKKLGQKYKTGIMLWGPPGNGKTLMIEQLIKKYEKSHVIIFVDEPFQFKPLLISLQNFKQPYIFILEEFTSFSRSNHVNSILLCLDGQYSIENQITIATTNYPEDLPGNIVDRPGRFDHLIQIENPDREGRRVIISNLLNRECTELELNLSKDLSNSYISQLCIQSKILNKSLEELLEENKKKKRLIEKNFSTSGSMGFGD